MIYMMAFKTRRFALGTLICGITMYSLVNILSIRQNSNKENIHSVKKFNIWKSNVTGDLLKRRKLWNDIVVSIESEVKEHRVPDVIGIGVRKCGTGAFLNFFKEHPLITTGGEAHYYDSPDVEKGIDYYKNVLEPASKQQLVMEKTPAYFTTLPAELPEIIKRDSPNVKLILLLCDPVNRALSDFGQRKKGGSLKTSNITFPEYFDKYFESVQKQFSSLTMEDDDVAVGNVIKSLRRNKRKFSFAYGIYAYFIRRWLKVFPPERFLVLDGEDFLKDPGSVFEKVQEFLNIPKLLVSNDFIRNPKTGLFCIRPWWNETYDFYNEYFSNKSWEDELHCAESTKGRTRSKTKMYHFDDESFETLKKFYKPYNEALYEILGKRFKW